jgi:hypothetical protein
LECHKILVNIANGVAKYTGGFVTISVTAPDGLAFGELVTHTYVLLYTLFSLSYFVYPSAQSSLINTPSDITWQTFAGALYDELQ